MTDTNQGNRMIAELSNEQVVQNLKNKLSELNGEIEEVYELEPGWKPKKDWHNTLNKLRTKQYLLKEILGEE